MDRACNLSFTSKINVCCFFKGNGNKNCLIYEVAWELFDTISIGNKQYTLKKSTDIHFSISKNSSKFSKGEIYSQPIINGTLDLPFHTIA